MHHIKKEMSLNSNLIYESSKDLLRCLIVKQLNTSITYLSNP